MTGTLTEKNLEDRLRRALRWHGHSLWKPRRRTDCRYWVVDRNACIDGADIAEELLERWAIPHKTGPKFSEAEWAELRRISAQACSHLPRRG
jgi:hypothetical protein